MQFILLFAFDIIVLKASNASSPLTSNVLSGTSFFSIFFSYNFQRFDFQHIIKKMAANLVVVRALSVHSCCKCQQEFPFRALTISDLSATSSKYQFLSLILCDTAINQKDIYIWKRKRHNCPRMLIEN